MQCLLQRSQGIDILSSLYYTWDQSNGGYRENFVQLEYLKGEEIYLQKSLNIFIVEAISSQLGTRGTI